MKKIIILSISVFMLCMTFNPNTAEAQCTTFSNDLGKKLYDEYACELWGVVGKTGKILEKNKNTTQGARANKRYKTMRNAIDSKTSEESEKCSLLGNKIVSLKDATEKLAALWSKWSDNSRWYSIKPRKISLNSSQRGTLYTERAFIVEPNLRYNDIDIIITKKGGKAPGNIFVCSANLESIEMMSYEGEEKIVKNARIGTSEKITVSNAFGKVLFVRIAKPAGTNKFEYTIEVKGRNPAAN